jgi:hypothetical protein
MPNHVRNHVRSDQMDQISPLLVNDKGEVDFNLAVPMPEGMVDIAEGSTLWTFRAAMGHPRPYEGRTPEQILEALRELTPPDLQMCAKAYGIFKETGYWSWYDWSYDKWGTKWNAYDCQVHIEDGEVIFDTAWGTPEAFFQALAAKLPVGVDFSVQWTDEGGPAGYDVYEGGQP